MLFLQDARLAASLTVWTAGNRRAIRIPTMAITTKSSTRVIGENSGAEVSDAINIFCVVHGISFLDLIEEKDRPSEGSDGCVKLCKR